jgi:uncharacterized membrane protein HdeD (DUF308 family)
MIAAPASQARADSERLGAITRRRPMTTLAKPAISPIHQLLIGFWAAGSPRQSVALLIIWVGAAALAPGIMEIILAFRVRGMQKASA